MAIKVYKAKFRDAAMNPYLWICDYCIETARHCFSQGELSVDYEQMKEVWECPTCFRNNWPK